MVRAVLRTCGRTLRTMHQRDVTEVLPGLACPRGAVLVHGDYGPNNVLLAPRYLRRDSRSGLGMGHPGQPVEDLAWCEWIIRMHHRTHVEAFEQSFDDCGQRRPGLPGKRQWWSGASGC